MPGGALHRSLAHAVGGARDAGPFRRVRGQPIDPPVTEASLEKGYTFQTRQKYFKSQDNLVVLAFSGGGTRAAAFSYGVLEFLRRTEAIASRTATRFACSTLSA